MGYFENALKEGFYISVANCRWNGIEYKEYKLQKDEGDDTTYVRCYLNKKAYREVIKRFNFPVVHQDKTVIELNKDFKPYPLQFETQTKEPLKITFS